MMHDESHSLTHPILFERLEGRHNGGGGGGIAAAGIAAGGFGDFVQGFVAGGLLAQKLLQNGHRVVGQCDHIVVVVVVGVCLDGCGLASVCGIGLA